MYGDSYDYFRVWVDGSPYDPNDLIVTSNNNYANAFNYQAAAFSRQLTLAAGAHQVQVQALEPNGSSNYIVSDAKLQLTGYGQVGTQAAANGLATSTSANIPLSYGAWTTVDSLNVTVDASKTGLYDLAFGATAGMYGNSYDYFRVWVDGSPYDPNDLIITSNIDYSSDFNYQAIAFSRQLTLAAGAHQVQVQALEPNGSSNYIVSDAKLQLTGYNSIQVAPTLSVTDAGGTYNGSAFAATATVAGVIPGVDNTPGPTLEGVAPTLAYYSGTYTTVAQTTGLTPLSGTPSAAGAYTVVASFAGSTDYLSATALADFSIAQKAASVTPNPATKVYGAADPTLTGTLSGFVAADGVTATYSRTTGETVAGGPYTISATLGPAGVLSNYAITYNTASFTITPAPLTITADAQTKVYGQADPTLTYQVTGLQNGDAAGSALSGGLVRAAGETVAGGPYSITIGTLTANANYTIGFTDNVLTITPAPLSVTANSKSKTYGAPNPTLDGTLTGVVNGDDITASYSTTATQFSDVVAGGYAITATLNDPDGLLSNYTVTSTGGTLTINRANQTITWSNPADIVYGTPLSGTQLDATVAGVPGGAAPGALTYSPAIGAVLPAFSGQGLAVSAAATTDYNQTGLIVYINVLKAPLSITANSASMFYGQPLPTLTGTLAGVVNNDAITATYSTTAMATSAAGAYPVAATLNDPNYRLLNYSVTNTPGTLTIAAAPTIVSITGPADPGGPTYGDVSGPITANIVVDSSAAPGDAAVPTGSIQFYLNGLPLGSPVAVVDGSAQSPDLGVWPAGDYTFSATYSNSTASGAPGDGDFTGSTAGPVSFTVDKATPAITWANPADIVYGSPLSGTQLNASASSNGSTVDGGFSYTPARGRSSTPARARPSRRPSRPTTRPTTTPPRPRSPSTSTWPTSRSTSGRWPTRRMAMRRSSSAPPPPAACR